MHSVVFSVEITVDVLAGAAALSLPFLNMSKRRRGMSLEEKRQVMLEILQESKTPFLLKELEKIGGKRGVGMSNVL